MEPMRVLMIGGTRFIGRRIVAELAARGDDLLLVHRGETVADDLPPCQHVHVERSEFAGIASAVGEFDPQGIVDTCAMTATDAEAILPHLPDVPLVLLSSMDTYRAYQLFWDGVSGEPLPIDETSPVREKRYPYRNSRPEMADYEKLDVEPSYLARGGTVLRLGMVYGEHDPQRREEFVLRRVRAGRTRIPIGLANWLWTRVYVGDVAAAVLAALDNPLARGEVLNIGEDRTATFADWVRQILAAADHTAELVTVPDSQLPDDLALTRGFGQHMLASSAKASRLLGWHPGDPGENVGRSVRWHLAHPPEDTGDFAADDTALGAI
jgi:nucleoside-diphosphate-sugar epimerase